MSPADLVSHEASEHFSATGHEPTVFADDDGNYISWACMTCDCYPELDRV